MDNEYDLRDFSRNETKELQYAKDAQLNQHIHPLSPGRKLQIPLFIPDPPGTETEKMLSGHAYTTWDPEITAAQIHREYWMDRFNHSSPTNLEQRNEILHELLGIHNGDGSAIRSPFHCGMGANIRLGKNSSIGANCTLLDNAPVVIGDNCTIGPNVKISPASHQIRNNKAGPVYGLKITIGDGCSIGAASILTPGVTIGEGSVVESGSIVTKDVPAYTLVGGNPARKLRSLTEFRKPEATPS